MISKILTKVMFVGRATTFVVGLGVILALVMGLASTALAGTGTGASLNLGVTNAVNQATALVGAVAGPSLKLDNSSSDASATALDLRVEPGHAPMKVHSGAKVAKLNADKIDGKDAASFVGADRFGADPGTYGHEGTGFNSQECMVGEVRLFAGTSAPDDWQWADGEVLQVQQNEFLFSLLGNQYGGDGQTTFALPDMRGIEPDGTRYMICVYGLIPTST